jgi:hypothetical protein
MVQYKLFCEWLGFFTAISINAYLRVVQSYLSNINISLQYGNFLNILQDLFMLCHTCQLGQQLYEYVFGPLCVKMWPGNKGSFLNRWENNLSFGGAVRIQPLNLYCTMRSYAYF